MLTDCSWSCCFNCSRADNLLPVLQFWLSSKKTQVRHSTLLCIAKTMDDAMLGL